MIKTGLKLDWQQGILVVSEPEKNNRIYYSSF